jgi:hypothetical protein
MKRKIKSALKELNWPVLEKSHDQPMIRVTSNSKTRAHIIYMPDKLHNRSTDMDYLHELGHAIFCERVHPIFSVNVQCAPHQQKRLFLPVLPAINAACDWFVGHWQIQLAEKQSLNQLHASLGLAEEILASPELPPLEIILDAAMIIAQSIRYLKEPIDCGGVLQIAVDAFLSSPPDQPTIDNCVVLINRLLATYTDQRVRLVPDGEFEVWELYNEGERDNTGSESTAVPSGAQ